MEPKHDLLLKLIKQTIFTGKPVTGYVVEKLNKATGRWVPVGKTDDTEMEIKGLQEGEEYEFRVKAVNEEGESEPLKTDHSIIAKNPYGKYIHTYRPGFPCGTDIWLIFIFMVTALGRSVITTFLKKIHTHFVIWV